MKATIILLFFLTSALAGISQTTKTHTESSESTTTIQTSKKKSTASTGKTEKDITKSILNDLVTMGIITDTSKVIFTLSYEKMEVNNKRQPDEIFRQFKEKYQVTEGYSISHTKTSTSTSTSITQ